jgi:hypothetical protein
MLVGEPGIGKTALCQALASYVDRRGVLPLVGRCDPEGSATLPDQPFVDGWKASRRRDAETLRAEIGSGVDAVGRLVPGVQTRPQVELAAPENPADDRLRLLSGLLDGLRSIGAASAAAVLETCTTPIGAPWTCWCTSRATWPALRCSW